MRDTTPAADAQLGALLRGRTPGERVRMATAMFRSAKRLALAGLRYENAHRDPAAERLALLQRLYGDDLAPAIRALVALHSSR
jgi:hypothetical protein